MLSSVFVGMIAAVYQFQGRPVRWALLLAPPLLVLVFVLGVHRQLSGAGEFCGPGHRAAGRGRCWRRCRTGMPPWGAGNGCWWRACCWRPWCWGGALVAISTHSEATNILRGSALQTLTFLATFSVVLVSSVGFVFMSRDRADENNRVLAALDLLTGVTNAAR